MARLKLRKGHGYGDKSLAQVQLRLRCMKHKDWVTSLDTPYPFTIQVSSLAFSHVL